MNLQEDYCFYEVSRLLEEKGFHAPDLHGLDSSQGHLWVKVTHQMAMKWLREKGIIITIDYCGENTEYSKKYYYITYIRDEMEVNVNTYSSYEEAVEAAIKYCLTNLINNETN